MTTRRSFLLGSAGALAALGLPLGLAHAQSAPTDRKFVFVFNTGGWDPTRPSIAPLTQGHSRSHRTTKPQNKANLSLL